MARPSFEGLRQRAGIMRGRLRGRDGQKGLDFARIYRRNTFRSEESRSGAGSTIEQTAYLRQVFPEVLESVGAHSLLDVPCGDFNWMRLVDLGSIAYVGADVVPELIEANSAQFGSEDRSFIVSDARMDPLPRADVVLCRDCLVHMSYEDGMATVRNLKASGSTYLLTTTFTARERNHGLHAIWRPLNLQRPPYDFPAPITIINERCTEAGMRFADKSLGLWRLADL